MATATSISMNFNFAGAVLPLVECEDGLARVPFRPLVEAMRMDWKSQFRLMQTLYFQRRLGICVGNLPHAGPAREVVLIRGDRVAAWLDSLNPELVCVAVNEDAADFLEARHEEWDISLQALNLHREQVFAGAVKRARAIERIDRIRDPKLKALALAELGVTWQPVPDAGDFLPQSA
jgi:hypothetical protein